jgi:8-oxo-dGTP pyrophosphatase MutT (NUDIX family)
MDQRTYRPRVEVIAVQPDGKVLAGVYDNDGCPGLPGGGVEDGENWVAAGLRELEEETGYVADGTPVLMPLPAVRQPWLPPYVTQAQADRAKDWLGSETRFILIPIGFAPSREIRESPACNDLRPRSVTDLDLLGDVTSAEYPDLFVARRTAWHLGLNMMQSLRPAESQRRWLAAALVSQI